MYKKMKALEHLSPSTEFSYWIENFLISRLRSQKFEELYDKTKNDADDAPRTFNELVEELKHYGRNI